MRLAIIADIHGNHVALEAVLAALEERRPDRHVVLGDLAYKGPHPSQVVRAVRSLKAVVIRGTAEDRLAGVICAPATGRAIATGAASARPGHAPLEDADQFNRWMAERLSDDDRSWLKALPFEATIEADGVRLYFVHACPANTTDLIYPWARQETLAGLFGDPSARAVVYGHIHQPYLRWVGGRAVVNAGSVGQPFDGDQRASAVVVEVDRGGLSFEFIRVPYDLRRVVADARREGIPALSTYETMMESARWPY
ncbi:MAG TPA: metallophosphoesterase family protein [Bacillota bacterium]|jgi:predicted phosphodiesterase